MKLPLPLRRWHALRAPRLVRDTPDGAIVQATGIARVHADEPAFIAPLAGVPAVVAWMKHTASFATGRAHVFERLHIRPFLLEADNLQVVVDGSHAELLLPVQSEGIMQEIAVLAGQRVTVVGSVVRDGIDVARDELAFRESRVACRLVGSRRHPLVITAA